MRLRGTDAGAVKHLITASFAASGRRGAHVGAAVRELGGGVDLVQEARAGPLDRELIRSTETGVDADALHPIFWASLIAPPGRGAERRGRPPHGVGR